MKAAKHMKPTLPIGQILGGMEATHEAKGFTNDEISQGHKKLGFTSAVGKFQPRKKRLPI
jgi:hypothetical protein